MLTFWSCDPANSMWSWQERESTAARLLIFPRSAPPAFRSQSFTVLSKEPEARRSPLAARHHTQPWCVLLKRLEVPRVPSSGLLEPFLTSHRFTLRSLEPEIHTAPSPPTSRTVLTSAMWPEDSVMCSKAGVGFVILDKREMILYQQIYLEFSQELTTGINQRANQL